MNPGNVSHRSGVREPVKVVLDDSPAFPCESDRVELPAGFAPCCTGKIALAASGWGSYGLHTLQGSYPMATALELVVSMNFLFFSSIRPTLGQVNLWNFRELVFKQYH